MNVKGHTLNITDCSSSLINVSTYETLESRGPSQTYSRDEGAFEALSYTQGLGEATAGRFVSLNVLTKY